MKRMNPFKMFLGCMIPNWLLRRDEISYGAKCCYARLVQFAGKKGYCFPSHSTLALELGCSRDSVIRFINELKEYGLIEGVRTNKRKTLSYYFLDKPDWIKPEDYRKTTSDKD